MKKFLALFMACAFACIATAASSTKLVFSRAQFQPSKSSSQQLLLTVPLIYKGTASYKVENLLNASDATTNSVCLESEKGTIPVYMTICQPCIDCYPCETLANQKSDVPLLMNKYGTDATSAALAGEKITKWNLYFIDTYKFEGEKYADIYKVNMIGDENAKFYSGSNKSGSLVYNAKGLWLSGKRSDYKFAYTEATLVKDGDEYKWNVGNTKATAYIKSISTLTGTYDPFFEAPVDGTVAAKVNATFKLTRNASLTKKAIQQTFSSTTVSQGRNWEDCSVTTPAAFCEEFFAADAQDICDAYIAATVYKNYVVEFFTGADYQMSIDAALKGIIYGVEPAEAL